VTGADIPNCYSARVSVNYNEHDSFTYFELKLFLSTTGWISTSISTVRLSSQPDTSWSCKTKDIPR